CDALRNGCQEPASFYFSISSYAKCIARDVGTGLKTGTCGTKWVYVLTTKFAIENDLLSGATDSQIAYEFELFTIEIDDFQRFEVQDRVVFGVDEIGRPQGFLASLTTSID